MTDAAIVKVRFDGQVHQIDVDTLMVSLLQLSNMTRGIVEDLSPGATVKIMISAPERGSFVIDLEIIQKAEEALVRFAPFVPQAVQTILNLMKIKLLLKGRKPDQVKTRDDGTTIIIKDNAEIIINNYTFDTYSKNEPVNTAISKMFAGIAENPEIQAVELDAPGIGEFRAEHADFASMGRPNELIAWDKTVIVEEAVLSIVKIVFEKTRVWEFVYKGIKISALITDNGFWDQVDNMRFGKGDTLRVDLEIAKVYDEEIHCFVNKFYRVLKVRKHEPGPQQLRFDEG